LHVRARSSCAGNSSSERLKIYGDNAVDIKNIILENPESERPVDPRLPYTLAEILWICRNEMPVNIEDVLARRTRSLFLNARASEDIAPLVADLMAEEFGHDQKWKVEQLESYSDLVKNYI
jgi:glycerol-3-phosphate dehydrogenase